MKESYRDSAIHFGSNTHWRIVRDSLKKKKRDTDVPVGVTRVFGRNPEAARLMLEEMAHSWVNPNKHRPEFYFSMTKQAVLSTVLMLRGRLEELLEFIGTRYAVGDRHLAALAFKHALDLARQELPKK
jgi:hypothetical protein